MSRLKFVEMKM